MSCHARAGYVALELRAVAVEAASRHAGGAVHRILVELRDDLFAEQLHRLDDLVLVAMLFVVGLKQQLVGADVDPPLDRLGAVVGIADDDHADLGRLLELLDGRLGDPIGHTGSPSGFGMLSSQCIWRLV